MICKDTIIEGNVRIGADSIVHPTAKLIASASEAEDYSVNMGERNIIEERCLLRDSSLGHGNLIEVGTKITNSKVGDFNKIGFGCVIENNCIIGSYCSISPGITLSDIIISDNTSIFMQNGELKTGFVDVKTLFPIIDAYRVALSVSSSPQCLSKHHEMR